VQTPALTVTKQGTPTTFDHVGQAISYTYTITNSGNEVAAISVSQTGSPNFSAPTSFQVAPNSSQPMTISFTNSGGLVSADFQITATDLCSTPFTVHVTGGDS